MVSSMTLARASVKLFGVRSGRSSTGCSLSRLQEPICRASKTSRHAQHRVCVPWYIRITNHHTHDPAQFDQPVCCRIGKSNKQSTREARHGKSETSSAAPVDVGGRGKPAGWPEGGGEKGGGVRVSETWLEPDGPSACSLARSKRARQRGGNVGLSVAVAVSDTGVLLPIEPSLSCSLATRGECWALPTGRRARVREACLPARSKRTRHGHGCPQIGTMVSRDMKGT